MATFEQLFPTFLQKCAELHELLRIVAFMLFIVGTILLVVHGFSAKTLMLHMVRMFVLTALVLELYCTRPLTNIRGVSVNVARFDSRRVTKRPCCRSTQLIDTDGSNEIRGVTS